MKQLGPERSELHEKLFLGFSMLVLITLPFSVKLNGLAMILLSINWIIEGSWLTKYKTLQGNKIALLFIALYFLHIAGLIHSQNISQGFSELEKKIAFVIFPIIFSTTKCLDRTKIYKILNYFVATCLLAAVICVLNGLYFLFFHEDSSYLFYHKLGAVINFNHAVYFSFYIAVSTFYILIRCQGDWQNLTKTSRAFCLFTIILFLIFLILLSSKTLIVTVFLILAFFVGRTVFQKKGILFGTVSILLSLTLSALIMFSVPNIKKRFAEVMVDQYNQPNPLLIDDYQYYHFTGGAIRLAIWKMTVEIVDDENAWLWGVGTGDSQDMLTRKYVERHVYGGDASLGIKGFLHYNAHNQFMQFFLMFGFPGLILFTLTLIYLFKMALPKDPILLCVLILFCAFSLTESTLHVQKGIVLFVFLTSLLSSRYPPAMRVIDFCEVVHPKCR